MLSKGYSVRVVGRHFGFSPGTISKWSKKALVYGDHPIPTKSSSPVSHPKRIPDDVRDRVAKLRRLLGRSIEIVHHELQKEGLRISLSSVYRILKEKFLIKQRSPWKRFHKSDSRPEVISPGDLLQIDTVHLMVGKKTRIYVYTLIDVFSRLAYARSYYRANARNSIDFVRRAKLELGFDFKCIQSDHGSEFSSHFTERVKTLHRHSRVRHPNDNAHIERFNRTLQEECLSKITVDVAKINKALKGYLFYYNHKRHHFSLNFKAPSEMILTA